MLKQAICLIWMSNLPVARGLYLHDATPEGACRGSMGMGKGHSIWILEVGSAICTSSMMELIIISFLPTYTCHNKKKS